MAPGDTVHRIACDADQAQPGEKEDEVRTVERAVATAVEILWSIEKLQDDIIRKVRKETAPGAGWSIPLVVIKQVARVSSGEGKQVACRLSVDGDPTSIERIEHTGRLAGAVAA